MTEKRFEIRQEDIDCDYLDLEGLISCIKCDGEFITYAEILNLLNKLSEENEELKSDLDYFQKTYEIEERGLDIVAPMCTIGSPTPSRLELFKENEELKNKIKSLTIELSTHKHPLWSTREAERKVNELTELLMNETKKNAVLLEEINSLRTENMRLKKLQRY